LWSQARVIVLAPIAFAAVGCSADPARFNDGSFRRQPDATGTLAARAAPERAAPPAGAVRLVPPGSIPANDGANRNAGVAAGGVAYGGAPEDPPIKISRPTVKSPVAVARADTIPAQAKASGGHEIVQPKVANARQPGKPAPEQHPAAPAVPKPAVVAPAEKPVGVDPVKATEAAPSFHWPVRGQVIAGFGPKADGQRNNGIDIAVPENTPIKAADDGVVIYSGNELKSFGNLLLVRHSNNYITAYAHAKELRVKRGDTIKSGEIIGMSGQSGNTDTPEIHFEIRKGSTPIDPVPLLHGA
jgi:murein DD-endopeptidase MepM/ murein hydrolase activator NlpD